MTGIVPQQEAMALGVLYAHGATLGQADDPFLAWKERR